MWQYAEHPDRFSRAEPPAWVSDWLARRRPVPGGPVVSGPPAGPAAPGSRAVAVASPVDPEAEAQAAARRARSQAARTAGIVEALDALDVWIRDQLQEGLATFPQRARAACRAAAQRLVDGKAAGLALLMDELPYTLFGLPEASRAGFIVTELGRIHLAAAAFRRQDALPGALRADAGRLMGVAQRREELLADPAAPRIRARWTAAGSRTVTQADKLLRVETWLAADDGERTALLVDYTPATAAVAAAASSGECFEAELVFYPSAAPLRAMVAQRGPPLPARAGPAARHTLPQAVAAHMARLAALPWLGDDLLLVAEARLTDGGGNLQLTDADGTAGLPLTDRDGARPLLGLALRSAAVIWDGRAGALLAADTPLGPWFATR